MRKKKRKSVICSSMRTNATANHEIEKYTATKYRRLFPKFGHGIKGFSNEDPISASLLVGAREHLIHERCRLRASRNGHTSYHTSIFPF